MHSRAWFDSATLLHLEEWRLCLTTRSECLPYGGNNTTPEEKRMESVPAGNRARA